MRRPSRFMLVLIALLVPTYVYIGTRLCETPIGWLALLIPFALILSFPLVIHHTTEDDPNPLSRLHMQGIFLSMGWLTYLFLATLCRDFLFGIARIGGVATAQNDAADFIPPWMIVAGAFLVFAAGTINAARGPRIRKIRINVDGLPKNLENFRIAQISDLHIGPNIRRRYVERVVRLTNSIRPDMVAMTGDIGDGAVSGLREQAAPLEKLEARFGIFYVPGNHEYYWNVADWIHTFGAMGATVLLNRGVSVAVHGLQVFVGGVTDPMGPMGGHEAPNAHEAARDGAHADYKILLSHRPEIAAAAEAEGFDLQLSGHTHGGQFFPWTMVVGFFHKFFVGLHKIGGMWIYVNSGTGSWGPLLRLGTTPEITQLELHATPAPAL